jgi:DNA-binding GntR family transcriptional regulator
MAGIKNKITTASAAKSAKKSSADRAYEHLRHMVMTYQFLPGEKINERALAMQVQASRTPLREALNRLVSEGLVTASSNEGFSCRPLDPKEIFDLYELRAVIESRGARFAAERATDNDILALEPLLEAATPTDEHAELVDRDVRFHEAIAKLSGNVELLHQIQAINTRVYFIRWIDRVNRQSETDMAHQHIFEALKARDGEKAGELMYNHIYRRMEHIIDVVKAGFAHLYTEKSVSRLKEDEKRR